MGVGAGNSVVVVDQAKHRPSVTRAIRCYGAHRRVARHGLTRHDVSGTHSLGDIERFLDRLVASKRSEGAIGGCLLANTLADQTIDDPDIIASAQAYPKRLRNAFLRLWVPEIVSWLVMPRFGIRG